MKMFCSQKIEELKYFFDQSKHKTEKSFRFPGFDADTEIFVFFELELGLDRAWFFSGFELLRVSNFKLKTLGTSQ